MAAKIKVLSNLELAIFCDQMAMALKAGISPAESFSIMNEHTSGKASDVLLQHLEEYLSETGKIAEALRKTELFPEYFMSMVEIGENTGKLDDVFESLGEHYQREENIVRSVKHAVLYPFVMISMMSIVVLVLLTKVLPIFAEVFEQLGHEMNGFSLGLLQVGTWMNHYSVSVVVILIAIMILLVVCTQTANGRKIAVQALTALGLGRKLLQRIAVCRVAGGMSIVLSSGLHIEQSVEMVMKLVEDSPYQASLKECSAEILKGEKISQALAKTGLFSGIYNRMITVGYRAGTLDEVMKKIAQRYEEEIDTQISRMIHILEPTLVAILSIIVGVVLLSVMLPLLGVMAGF